MAKTSRQAAPAATSAPAQEPEINGRLSNLCLTKIFVCAVEHDICNAISEDIICFFKQFFC